MDPLLILGLIGLAPIVLLTLTRASAATAFLALCLGSVLGSYVASDLVSLLRGYIAPDSRVTESFISLGLLWLPVLLVAVLMARSISARQRLINLLPAIAVGLLGILLSVPFLTPAVSTAIEANELYQNLVSYQAAVVAAGTLVSLFLLKIRKKDDGHHGKHHR